MTAQPPTASALAGKHPHLTVLSREPLVAETPEEGLDAATTPNDRFFVRNNGLMPDVAGNPDVWTLRIDGEVERSLHLTLADLKSRFAAKTFRMVLECGGNGRAFFSPETHGVPWTHGGVGCAAWTGVSLRDVLEEAGLKGSAVYTAHYGADPDLSGRSERPVLSRGMRLAKALEEHTLLAWGMNGEPLPALHGGPLRLVVPGWPGSLSQKWLTRIWIRDREHDGPGMTGLSYRVPVHPVPLGSDGKDVETRILESMPVRSIVTSPAEGALYAAGTRQVAVRGAAWAGDDSIVRVEVSLGDGAPWVDAALEPLHNRYDWTRWSALLAVPEDGDHEIRVRATDSAGRVQPPEATGWNPNGYGCNAMHRVRITVGPAV